MGTYAAKYSDNRRLRSFQNSKPFSKIKFKGAQNEFSKINGALIDNCWYQIPFL